MRGRDRCSATLTWTRGLGGTHPLRTIQAIANAALADLTREFAGLYPPRLGRPSIAPERLLRAMLLQAFYGIRSERQLMERMEFDLLFRWFGGLGVDDPVWGHSSFSKNRTRLLEGAIAAKFLAAVLAQPKSIDRRVTRHAGYAISQRCRKRIEEVFGWIRGAAGLAKVKLRGRARVDAAFTLALAVYNLIRLPRLPAAPA